jgi:phage gpG-like protein
MTLDRALHLVGAEQAIKKMIDTAKSMKQATGKGFYSKAVAYVFSWTQRNFRGEGEKVGGWKPLAASTIKMRQKERAGKARILQNKGWLRDHWRHEIGDTQGALVSAEKYGIYHDSDKPRKIAKSTGQPKLPRRRILPTHAEMKEPLRKIIDNEIRTALR